jgi:hypothetical protein
MKRQVLLLILIVFAFIPAPAHVGLNYPAGGETFVPGDTISIQWEQFVEHDLKNWDLFFSGDGGLTWDTIRVDIADYRRSYTWVVPFSETMQGQIRVVQDNVEFDYEDISEVFTVSAITAIDQIITGNQLAIYPNPFTYQTTVDFANPGKKRHTLAIFNVQGQLVQTKKDILTDQIIIHRQNLPEGLYFIYLSAKDGERGIGRLMVE